MTMIALTEVINGNEQLLAINPDHVTSLRPRKTVTALDVQQGDPRSSISYDGTIVALVTGEQHFVLEDFTEVHQKVMGKRPVPPPPTALTAQEKAARVASRLGMSSPPTPTHPAPDLGDDPDGDNTT